MNNEQKTMIIDQKKENKQKYRRLFIVYCLLFIVSPIFFFRLGSTTLTNWDEAWFASVAADMAARRDFLVGHWNGQVWFYEPPMLTWVLAGMMTVFGKQEFWLRSFNALCGLLTVLLSVRLAHKVSGSRLAGFLAGVILLSDIEFLFRSRQINVEVPVALFLLASLSSSLLAAKTRKARWFVSTGFFLGLSFLTKRASPVLAIPAIGYIFWWMIRRNVILEGAERPIGSQVFYHPRMTMVLLLIAFITFLITSFPWFAYQYWRFGDQFLNEFFIGYTLGKIRAINPGAGTSPLFYLSAIKHAFKIWSLVIPIAIAWVIWAARKKREYRVLLLYAATFFSALTVASIKSSWFLLSIHPILAVITGVFLDAVGTTMKSMRSIRYFSAGVISLVVVQLYVYRHHFIVPDTTSHQVKLVERARSITMSIEPLYLDDEYLPVAVFYSNRRVIPLRFNRGQPIIDLDVPVGSIILSNTETVERLKEQVESPLETLASERDLLLLRVGSGKNQESEEKESGKREV